jgi:hypothetical protein
VFISGDLDEFQGENRGGRHISDFYDYFPDLEDSARQYTLERGLQKSADFTVLDLANFIDKTFYEITNTPKGKFFVCNMLIPIFYNTELGFQNLKVR